MWTTRCRRWERGLVAECEAFLSGHYAQNPGDNDWCAPGWARLNVLAHGSDADVATLAANGGQPWDNSAWPQALAFLAQELLSEATRQGRPLPDLQRSTLVPLELDLLEPSEPSCVELFQFVTSVLSAREQHRTNQH